MTPEEEALQLEAILASSIAVSVSNTSMLFQLSYAELDLYDDYVVVLNPNNPFTIKVNGARLTRLIGIGHALRIVFILKIIRVMDKL